MGVTKDTNIAELLENHPGTVEVFMKFGLQCAGCMAAAFDTLEQGAKAHGLPDETMEEIMKALQKTIDGDSPRK